MTTPVSTATVRVVGDTSDLSEQLATLGKAAEKLSQQAQVIVPRVPNGLGTYVGVTLTVLHAGGAIAAVVGMLLTTGGRAQAFSHLAELETSLAALQGGGLHLIRGLQARKGTEVLAGTREVDAALTGAQQTIAGAGMTRPGDAPWSAGMTTLPAGVPAPA